MDATRAGQVAREAEAWYHAQARDLPWRSGAPDPWAVLVSEVLLQQTRVATAKEAFPRLMARFPDPAAMAAATEEEVLRAWAGLGYYRRARNLQAAARAIVARHAGAVPSALEDLAALPGVGPYTAAAVHAFAFNGHAAPLDANVARVLARLTGEARPLEAKATMRALEEAALAVLRHGAPRVLGQALMELGALVCTARAPTCAACPLATLCEARARGAQETLPVKRAKAKPREERWAFALVTRRRPGAAPGEAHGAAPGEVHGTAPEEAPGPTIHEAPGPSPEVLLERRGPGLLEGFWAPPGVALERGGPLAAEALEACLGSLGVAARVGAPSARGRWVFTHRVWRFAVHPARLAATGSGPGPGPTLRPRRDEAEAEVAAGEVRWVAASELDRLPIAKPLEAQLRAALAPAPSEVAAARAR